MTNLPQFETYGNYSSGNYGVHALRFFDAEGNCFWFSYNTLVAFKHIGGPRVVRSNDWGPTTGKHLNCIDGGDRETRVSGEVFAAQFQEQFGEEIAA